MLAQYNAMTMSVYLFVVARRTFLCKISQQTCVPVLISLRSFIRILMTLSQCIYEETICGLVIMLRNEPIVVMTVTE